MNKHFFLDDSPMYKNKYVIRIDPSQMPFENGMRGSFDVLIARLLNLPYVEYLRYCRDRLGAELVGKNSRYIVPYFDSTNEVKMFVKLLNKRMDYVLNEREFPYNYTEEEGEVVRTPFNEEDDH